MSKTKYFLILILSLIIGVVGTLVVIKMNPSIVGLDASQAKQQAEANKLVAEVGLLIALPEGEKPTVATVSDIDKVKDQPFFKNAKNGDKVLIYTNAKKAILYRPSEKRIIEVGAVNINNDQQTDINDNPTTSPTPVSTSTPVSN
ncbi:MAG TPA: hypothetical protein VFI61_00305 [Patescibacteria group bacterium]|nr:hypothetical protein [Patescibacteria group bacterium]